MTGRSPLDGFRDLTLANNCLVDVTLEARARAARHGGFDGIGLSIQEYDRVRLAGASDSDIAAVLGQHGLRVTELEAIVAFARLGERDAAPGLPAPSDPGTVERLLQVGEALGAERVQALGTFGAAPLEPYVVDRFAELCDRAADHGLSVAIEFLPGTNIPNVAIADTIVSEARRSNGGLCVDSWHFFRGDPDLDALRRVPRERLLVVQLNDGALKPVSSDYLFDTKNHRLLAGQGEFDLAGFLAAVGSAPAVSAEVLSGELRTLHADDAAERIGSASRRVLSEAATRQQP